MLAEVRGIRWVAAGLVLAYAGVGKLRAQGPTLPSTLGAEPGSVRSSLGPMPGAGGNPFGLTPGTDASFLGGRPGPSFPRVPSDVTIPGGRTPPHAPAIILAPARLPITDVPLHGPLEVPSAAEEEGPLDGITLDQAIDRLLRENLALRALSYQIPAAQADVLTAGLRANPIVYTDAQLVPYGSYGKDGPGGPTQYDVNVTHPVDYSGKRIARTIAAERAVDVVSAQYQDAARIQVDNLYTAFVSVIAARETVRFAEASVVGLGKQLEYYEILFRRSNVTLPELARARKLLGSARVGEIQASEMLLHAKRTLANLLNIAPTQAESLSLRGRLADVAPPPPPFEDLVRVALESRPDLQARRLGMARAEANLGLARADRFGDGYVLYQPYTFQDIAPSGLKSATSWALGATIPIPLYNRNQGGVLRARLNLEQTSTEVVAGERAVIGEVQNALRLYDLTRRELLKIETELLPTARQMRDNTFRMFVLGELTALEVETSRKDYNEVVRRYRDALIRHRRAMLSTNTAVGRRVMP
jgi:outer membrane protein, heavy metal efflux system